MNIEETPIADADTPCGVKGRRMIRDLIYRLHCGICEWVLDKALLNHPEVRNSNIVSYAESEIHRAGLADPDSDYGGMLADAALRSVRMFALEGHSGFSAGMANNIVSRLCAFKPLTPLTGEPDEWNEVEPGLLQNRRMSAVFKNDEGAYWIEGRVFREPNGVCYTSRDSRVWVEFPWMPGEPEIVDVDGEPAEHPPGQG